MTPAPWFQNTIVPSGVTAIRASGAASTRISANLGCPCPLVTSLFPVDMKALSRSAAEVRALAGSAVQAVRQPVTGRSAGREAQSIGRYCTGEVGAVKKRAVAPLRFPAAAREDRGRASRPDRRWPLRSMNPGQPDPTVVRRHLLALVSSTSVARDRRGRCRPGVDRLIGPDGETRILGA